jgi:hypothetical protein
LVVQISLDAYRESARVHIRSTVVQLQANFFHSGKETIALEKARIKTFQRNQRFVVDFLQEIFCLLADFVRVAIVRLQYQISWYVRLVIYMATTTKILGKVFTVEKGFYFLFFHLNTAISAPKVLLLHLLQSFQARCYLQDELFAYGRPKLIANDSL